MKLQSTKNTTISYLIEVTLIRFCFFHMDPNIRNAKPMSYPVSQNSPNLSTKQPMIYNGRVGGNFTIPSNLLPTPVSQIHGVTHPGEFCSSLPMNDMVTIKKLSHKRNAPTSLPP